MLWGRVTMAFGYLGDAHINCLYIYIFKYIYTLPMNTYKILWDSLRLSPCLRPWHCISWMSQELPLEPSTTLRRKKTTWNFKSYSFVTCGHMNSTTWEIILCSYFMFCYPSASASTTPISFDWVWIHCYMPSSSPNESEQMSQTASCTEFFQIAPGWVKLTSSHCKTGLWASSAFPSGTDWWIWWVAKWNYQCKLQKGSDYGYPGASWCFKIIFAFKSLLWKMSIFLDEWNPPASLEYFEWSLFCSSVSNILKASQIRGTFWPFTSSTISAIPGMDVWSGNGSCLLTPRNRLFIVWRAGVPFVQRYCTSNVGYSTKGSRASSDIERSKVRIILAGGFSGAKVILLNLEENVSYLPAANPCLSIS